MITFTRTASDLEYTVTVGDQTFVLSVENNGTDVMLPEADLLVPARLPVTVSVISSAPVPDIQINSVINNVQYPERLCGKVYTCEWLVSVWYCHDFTVLCCITRIRKPCAHPKSKQNSSQELYFEMVKQQCTLRHK